MLRTINKLSARKERGAPSLISCQTKLLSFNQTRASARIDTHHYHSNDVFFFILVLFLKNSEKVLGAPPEATMPGAPRTRPTRTPACNAPGSGPFLTQIGRIGQNPYL